MSLRRCLPLSLIALFACPGPPAVNSEAQARRAYLGLDQSVSKSMQLGFDGFNAASSANIAPQSTAGARSGTLTITGKVDQGSSDNKGMRLKLAMVNYSDGDAGTSVDITYTTPIDGGVAPALDLSLKGIPTGTFTGTLLGDFSMSGGLTGSVNLDLAISGQLEDGGSGTVRRKAGSTSVTGKATAGTDVFQINVTL